jgi:hypothetical protein
MAQGWTPPLQLHPRTDRCQLSLEGVATGYGVTLQDAVNDLLVRLHDLGVGVHRGGLRLGHLDPRVGDFLWEIGDVVTRGGDLRARVLGA